MGKELTYWICSNCHTPYLHRPERCIRHKKINGRWGIPWSCDANFESKKITDIIGYCETWDTFDGLGVQVKTSDGEVHCIYFHGEAADVRLREVVDHLREMGVPSKEEM